MEGGRETERQRQRKGEKERQIGGGGGESILNEGLADCM